MLQEKEISNGVKVDILGVLVNKINKKEILDEIENWLETNSQHYIVTPNPEIILAAQEDEELKNILNKADIAICDGIGLKIVSYFLLNPLKRVQGSDLTDEILKSAGEKNYKIYFLNWVGGLSETEEIKKFVQEKFGQIEIEGQGIERGGKDIDLAKINNFKPDILFVALGAPFQEKIISRYLSKITSVRLAMSIGGTFDFITGKIKRAPKIFRNLGLEWIWRLLKQPWRIKRIFNASIKFPYLVIKSLAKR